MRTAALHAPDWLVVIDNGSYETLTYFLSRAIAELWQTEHGGRLYKYEYSPPYWRAAKPRKNTGFASADCRVTMAYDYCSETQSGSSAEVRSGATARA
jgi:hypothetical protein